MISMTIVPAISEINPSLRAQRSKSQSDVSPPMLIFLFDQSWFIWVIYIKFNGMTLSDNKSLPIYLKFIK
jgi:hypothetical protein